MSGSKYVLGEDRHEVRKACSIYGVFIKELIKGVKKIMDKKMSGPQMTAYQTMLLIFSELVKKGKTVLRQDSLIQILYDNFVNTTDENVKLLFEDIAFNKNLDSITSVDIEDSLSKLQTYGAIGRLNPAYEKIVIYISPEEAETFIKSFDNKFVKAAEEVARCFNNGRA